MRKVITIIIPIHNRIETSKQGLKAIFNAITYFNEIDRSIIFKVIVVDDGSTDGSSLWISENFFDVKLLLGNGDLWWTGSVNLGIDYSIKFYKDNLVGVILQNDDVFVKKDWLINFYKLIVKNSRTLIGCAAVDQEKPNIIEYGGNTGHPWFARMQILNKEKKVSQIDPDLIIESYNLIGRGLYIPTSVFREIGLFDSKHFKHRGDTELSLRAKKKGYKLLVSYRCLVYINLVTTSHIDTKKFYKLSDFKKKFFNFRSSSYWKYRFYYAKYQSNFIIQKYIFFFFDIASHLGNYIRKLKL